MKELIDLRKPREKHFLNEDGTITLNMYNEDVHYKRGNEYIEIDNNLIEDNNKIKNKENDFKVNFSKDKFLVNIVENDNYINISLEDNNLVNDINYQDNYIIYKNILPNIDIKYDLVGKTAKETIVVNSKIDGLDKIKFNIDTNLELIIKDNKVIAIDGNGEKVYEFIPPYMIDDKQDFMNCYYELEKLNSKYLLTLVMDKEWLDNASYPVLIDPTITGENSTVYDTYIYPGDTNVNRNSHEYLKVGVDSNNVKYRILTKFSLPALSTSCSVVSATANYVSYPDDIDDGFVSTDYIGVYALTKEWDEATATWASMSEACEQLCHDYTTFKRTKYTQSTNTKSLVVSTVDITNLVKDWYNSKSNFGFMLKYIDEQYTENIPVHKVYSKNNSALSQVGIDPKPYLTITYRSRNGHYVDMTYIANELGLGTSYLNVLNGNIVNCFAINRTTKSDLKVDLTAFYNTNDIIENNNICFAKGWRFNYDQTIRKVIINTVEYLEYINGSGNVNYILKNNDGKYQSEDGIEMDISFIDEKITMKLDDCTMKFSKYLSDSYILTEIEDYNSKKLIILRNNNNRITSIKDSEDKVVNFVYNDSSILVKSEYLDTTLNIINSKLESISSKYGEVKFNYNEIGLIQNIIDLDNQKLNFEYYDNSPYRAKRIMKSSINGIVGFNYEISYSLNTTTIKKSTGIISCYAFDKYDNLVGVTSHDISEKLKSYYGYNNSYQMVNIHVGASSSNQIKVEKLSKSSITLRPIVNLVSNKYMFNRLNDIYKVEKIPYENLEKNYLRIKSSLEEQIYTVSEGGYYTLSFDAKNESLGDVTVKLKDYNGVSKVKQITISKGEKFERYSITNYFESNADIVLGIDNNGMFDIDNFQLEYCSIANPYNLIQNPCFDQNESGWSILTKSLLSKYDNSVTKYKFDWIKGTEKACHIEGSPYYQTIINQPIDVIGKFGESFNLSFLYKNLGLHEALDEDYDFLVPGAKVMLRFIPTSSEVEEVVEDYFLNKHSEWGIFNQTFIAPYDFDKIILEVEFAAEINDFYATYFSLIRQPHDFEMKYDSNGRLSEYSDSSDEKIELSYNKENQISKIISNGKKNIVYEYDKNDAKQLINVLNLNGVKQNLIYDEDGKIKSSKSRNVNCDNNLNNINIRAKGTNKYIDVDYKTKRLILKENECNISAFNINNIEKAKNICLSSISNNYICDSNGEAIVSNFLIPTCFDVMENDDGSCRIMNKENNKFLYISNDKVLFNEFVDNDDNFDFYFEGNSYLECLEVGYSFEQTTKKQVDSLGNTVQYIVDDITNLLKETVDPCGIKTVYKYNDLNQLIEIEKEEKHVYYEYNEQSKTEKIISGNKKYGFMYDEFLNISKVLLNNNVLFSYEYDFISNNLIKQQYANGDSINYYYDVSNNVTKIEFDSENNESHVVEYFYDNFNRLARVKCDDRECSISYDLLNKKTMYNIDDVISIVHAYNSDELLVDSKYEYKNQKNDVTYTYDEANTLVKSTMNINGTNSGEFSYEYDHLGRMKKSFINSQIVNSIEYYSNGYKSTSLIKHEVLFGKEYDYIYNKYSNLEEVYCEGILVKNYKYDKFERLIKEVDYKNGVEKKYEYDLEGNILNVIEKSIDNGKIIHTDKYVYSDEQDDLLVAFNDVAIEYDQMGNPIKIGDSLLTWEYGKKLASYNLGNNEIKYKYDYDGNRIEKNINGTKTKYYYDGNKLFAEDRNGNVLTYLYDGNSGLLGFTYLNYVYYYEKNKSDDIVGILDNNLNKIVTYEYDSWGKLISIKDKDNNEVTSKYHIGSINPFRYRCYYYDSDIEMYYLKNRMYNPVWRRFINADGIINAEQSIDGYNFYSYVSNDPINNFDVDGNFSFKNAIKKVKNVVVNVAKKVEKILKKTVKKSSSKKVNTVKLSTNTKQPNPKISLKDTNTKKISIPGGEIKIESSVSVNSRGQKIIDETIEIDSEGNASYNVDVGNNSVSISSNEKKGQIKIPIFSTGYNMLFSMRHIKENGLNSIFGHYEIGIGYGYDAEYASADNMLYISESGALSSAMGILAAKNVIVTGYTLASGAYSYVKTGVEVLGNYIKEGYGALIGALS